MWSPRVTRSTPASRICRYAPGVIPDPPEAFSALAITSPIPSRATSAGSARFRNATPTWPTMSPMKRIFISGRHRSACVLHRPRLADHGDLDLAGVVELLLDGPGDVAADPQGVAVAGLRGVGDDADLSAGLDGVGVL